MIHKSLFYLAHELGDVSFYKTYKHLMNNQWKPYEEQKLDQEKQLRQMITFSYENVPYYHNLFKKNKLLPQDIKVIEDLEKIPILTKKIIKEQWEELKPINLASQKYYNRATGGSTGTPMQYRISKKDRFLSGALLYRGWGNGGYHLGDKMIFLAGSSLDTGNQSLITKKTNELMRNIKKLSSFDMGEIEMDAYAKIFIKFKPKYLRGYASSIFYFARWLNNNQISLPSLSGVFTTAEKIFPHMRKTIGDTFDCDVYDNYGLNDGGISAFECPKHQGMHVDSERSIIEVIDNGGKNVNDDNGEIIVTSLHNYAMPFIRYDTGDRGFITVSKCSCKREGKTLKEIIGRENEFLITPRGQYVHGVALFNLIFHSIEATKYPGEVNKIKEFQVIQNRIDKITIVISADNEIPEYLLDYISISIRNRFEGWDVQFQLVKDIDRTIGGKYKFIINKLVE